MCTLVVARLPPRWILDQSGSAAKSTAWIVGSPHRCRWRYFPRMVSSPYDCSSIYPSSTGLVEMGVYLRSLVKDIVSMVM